MSDDCPKFGDTRKRNAAAASPSGSVFNRALGCSVFGNAGAMRIDQDVGIRARSFHQALEHLCAVRNVHSFRKAAWHSDPADSRPLDFGERAPGPPSSRRRPRSIRERMVVRCSAACFFGFNQQIIRYFDGGLHTATHITIYMGLAPRRTKRPPLAERPIFFERL